MQPTMSILILHVLELTVLCSGTHLTMRLIAPTYCAYVYKVWLLLIRTLIEQIRNSSPNTGCSEIGSIARSVWFDAIRRSLKAIVDRWRNTLEETRDFRSQASGKQYHGISHRYARRRISIRSTIAMRLSANKPSPASPSTVSSSLCPSR